MIRPEAFIDELKTRVTALTERLTAGSVELGIQIDGQSADMRAAAWYEAPRLFMTVSGADFIMPFGWHHFSELLRAAAGVSATAGAVAARISWL